MMNRIRRMCAGILTCMMVILNSAAPVAAAPGYDQIANAKVQSVGSWGMTPIYADVIPDGTYEVSVDSSSHFFKVLKADLTVKDGKMEAVMTMYSSSYSLVYMGTAEEAAADALETYIEPVEINYYDTFTVPVEALNKPIDCAAFSKKKKKWYSRKLVFEAASLPAGTLPFELPDYELIDDAMKAYEEIHPERFAEDAAEVAEDSTMEMEEPEGVTVEKDDGDYSIEVSLAGGSGRASVTSPTWFYVREGQAYAKLLWSSMYYDYMILDGKTYLNETTDGSNSTFTIPVTAMDEPMTVIADTTAMGEPVEIEYTLTFYRDTIGSKSNVPQEGAIHVVIIALVVMIGGGILNHLVKTKKKK